LLFSSGESIGALLESISRESLSHAVLRACHVAGATVLILGIYLHIFRSVRVGVSGRSSQSNWWSGILLLLLYFAAAFVGYCLPWSLMAYWALVVITNLASSIPQVGQEFLAYLWGGEAVSGGTLSRFYSVHWVVPLLGVLVLLWHVGAIHGHGSSSAAPGLTSVDLEGFLHWGISDMSQVSVISAVSSLVGLGYGESVGHPDGYSESDRFSTPSHIVPEWYYLPMYSLLRACSSKLWGLGGLVASIFSFGSPGQSSVSFGTESLALGALGGICSSFWILGLLGGFVPAFPVVECVFPLSLGWLLGCMVKSS
jgi:ubiquinol-cytochrome c reductase cytochrome b subunit